jgi:hypothetical protein
MAILTFKPPMQSSWLKWEQGGWVCRQQITILAGSGSDRVLKSGMVLGKITASGKYVQLNTAASDGSQNAAAILAEDMTAPNGTDAKGAGIVRGQCVVSDNGLLWPSGITTNQIGTATTQLIALGILVREGA